MYAVSKKMTKLNYDQNESCYRNFHSGRNSIFVIFLLTAYIYVHPIGHREQCRWGPFWSPGTVGELRIKDPVYALSIHSVSSNKLMESFYFAVVFVEIC